MQCQNLRNVPSACSGSLQFATLGCVVNAPKIFAASIIRMEINMVKMNFPYTGHEFTGIVEILQHSFLRSARNEFSGQPHATATSFPGKEPLVPFKLEVSGPQSPFQYSRGEKNLFVLPGLKSRTVQPSAKLLNRLR